ncbi:MAG: pseudouridine synthase [Methylovirgula sp.]|jgi:23S rRNA pseudouridine2605 synthase
MHQHKNKIPHPRPNRTTAPQTADSHTEGNRIAKVIARAGLCSRRDAEAWIAQGRVAVNGKTLTTPAVVVQPSDQIVVDGHPLAQRQRTRLFLFHKPRGLVTTHKDPEGRPTIFDFLREHAPEAPRLMSVGRLDINTEGLLLLTNDGGVARILELPTTGWLRRYRVRAHGETSQAVLDQLAKGVTIDGMRYAGIDAKLDRQQGANCWLTMGLREGKNREIKRVLEHLGLPVTRLIRISFGPFQLGELGEGKIEEVRTRVLRDQLGEALAEAAGADFDAPLEIEPKERPAPAREPRRAIKQPGARPSKGPRAHRAEPEAEAEKIRHRPQPGPRKHVSALRAREKDASEPRRRIEKSAISDRKGRTIEIERRVEAKKPAPEKPARGKRPLAESGRTFKKDFVKPQRRDERTTKPRGKSGEAPSRRPPASGKKPRGRG